jgi:hypothetical protein
MDIADRLRELIAHHLSKVTMFDPFEKFPGVKSASDFLKLIGNDPAFAPFDLAREKYITARVGGNLVTSVHRKIGDLYEDITQEILSTTIGIPRESLVYSLDLTIGNKTQTRSTDGRILLNEIKNLDTLNRVSAMIPSGAVGLALEIRSCYQIGDSKRIQADRDMALALRQISLSPVMLVYCETSLRSPIIRLSQYWCLKEGKAAFDYIHQLTGFNLLRFLNENKSFIKERMDTIFEKF